MEFFKEVIDVGRRATVDALQSSSIEEDAPFSPDLPEDDDEFAHNMPDLYDRFPVVWPWSEPQLVDPAIHTVWILDNTAFRTPSAGDRRPYLAGVTSDREADPILLNDDGGKERVREGDAGSGWEVEFVACYFIKNSGRDIAKKVSDVMHIVNASEDDDATKKRIMVRLQPFTDTVLPLRTVRISLSQSELQTLGPSSHAGLSTGLHRLHFTPSTATFPSHALNVPSPFSMPATTTPYEERGWALISSIDDTLKLTNTPSSLSILLSTFITENPEPISGMPELFKHVSTLLRSPPFFYLSASPYLLYPFLQTFRKQHYPPGPLLLRDATYQNLSGLITSLTDYGPKIYSYKLDRIRKIHSWFPHRRFILVGDSTQQDPEIYAAAARELPPGWIRAIYVRRVPGDGETKEKMDLKNSAERFESAFKGLKKGLWYVFEEPGELAERIEELREGEKGGEDDG